jgi:hypothetical protein
MWNEMWLPRAPENKRTGIEISPNVKYPDHTEEAMFSSFSGETARWKRGHNIIRRSPGVRQALFLRMGQVPSW